MATDTKPAVHDVWTAIKVRERHSNELQNEGGKAPSIEGHGGQFIFRQHGASINIHHDVRWLTLDIYGDKNEQKWLTADIQWIQKYVVM